MSNKKALGFFVIGAQKSGTTSLHHYLKQSPEISLPIEKEAPFFSDDETFSRGLDRYLDESFPSNKPAHVLLGTVTPQYMGYPIAPERMNEVCPNAKVIAILRDPIERAESHYKMRVRAFGEKISFQDMIEEQLTSSSLALERSSPSDSDSLVVWGEYGRILSKYLEYFKRENMLIVYSEDLKYRPEKVLGEIYSFLKVQPVKFRRLKKEFNSSSETSKITVTRVFANLIQYKIVRTLGKLFMSERMRRYLKFWSRTNRHTPTIAKIDVNLSPSTLRDLRKHFLQDSEIMEDFLLSEIIWKSKLKA